MEKIFKLIFKYNCYFFLVIEVSPAIPIIMGANIGTTVTNTIVALVQIGEKEHFRRAFASATVHDMFNLLSVIVLLPLEVATQYLFRLTKAMVQLYDYKSSNGGLMKGKNPALKKITKPITNLLIQLDKNAIEKIALAKGNKTIEVKSLIKHCDKNIAAANVTGYMQNSTLGKKPYSVFSCKFLFHDTGMSDLAVGIILLILSLLILCICLRFITKTLHSLLRAKMALCIRKMINADFKKPFKFLTGYVAISVGAGMTVLIQSSSVYTSTLTLLVGMGIITLRRVYPLTLGANIGTTATSMLTAFATHGRNTQVAIQLALCHLFFNITGLIIWYPVPFMRKAPTNLAKALGNTVADYKWFAFIYLIFVFFVFPGIVLGLSLAGWKVFVGIMAPVGVFVTVVFIINILQNTKFEWLPESLQTWDFLPEPCRSLDPYDHVISNIIKKLSFKKMQSEEE